MLRAVPVGLVLSSLPERIGEADAVEMGLDDPLDLGGRMDADQLEHGREDIDRVGVVPADRTGVGAPTRGTRTMHGSATPPSWTSRFQRLKGVFPAIVHPQG